MKKWIRWVFGVYVCVSSHQVPKERDVQVKGSDTKKKRGLWFLRNICFLTFNHQGFLHRRTKGRLNDYPQKEEIKGI